jgi:hypothetical protein
LSMYMFGTSTSRTRWPLNRLNKSACPWTNEAGEESHSLDLLLRPIPSQDPGRQWSISDIALVLSGRFISSAQAIPEWLSVGAAILAAVVPSTIMPPPVWHDSNITAILKLESRRRRGAIVHGYTESRVGGSMVQKRSTVCFVIL